MSIAEASERWDRRRAKWRERIAHVTPMSLTLYPYEVLAITVGFLMGIPVLLGFARPESLVLLLPPLAYYVWSSLLVLGAGTVLWGLRKLNPPALASGLQLLGGCFGVYSLAVIKVAGFERGWAVSVAFFLLFILAWARALHFRRTTDIQVGASQVGNVR